MQPHVQAYVQDKEATPPHLYLTRSVHHVSFSEVSCRPRQAHQKGRKTYQPTCCPFHLEFTTILRVGCQGERDQCRAPSAPRFFGSTGTQQNHPPSNELRIREPKLRLPPCRPSFLDH